MKRRKKIKGRKINQLCECGCGQLAPIATSTRTERGQTKGLPVRFIKGHNGRGKSNKIKVVCAQCGKGVYKKPSEIKKRKNLFCSKSCFYKRRSSSNDFSGKNNPRWKGGKVKVICAWCGKEKEVEPCFMATRKDFFCNHQCYGKWLSFYKSGKNNSNWQNGVSFEPYCPLFSDKEYKESIRDRDKHRCQNPYCYGDITPNRVLSIHHIDYDKKECCPDNLITLCVGCNNRANKDREWHSAWYQAILFRQNKLNGNTIKKGAIP